MPLSSAMCRISMTFSGSKSFWRIEGMRSVPPAMTRVARAPSPACFARSETASSTVRGRRSLKLERVIGSLWRAALVWTHSTPSPCSVAQSKLEGGCPYVGCDRSFDSLRAARGIEFMPLRALAFEPQHPAMLAQANGRGWIDAFCQVQQFSVVFCPQGREDPLGRKWRLTKTNSNRVINRVG